ncbi:hypothetical protein [Actinomadura sp. 3N508]|uniref:hypothetical protein n=1 Tax=Actinomadura sp. 3N508 TaxID=3375153 RepID=UPI00379DA70A
MTTPHPDIQVACGIPEVKQFREADQQAVAVLVKLQDAEHQISEARKALAREPGNAVARTNLRTAEARARRLERALDDAEAHAAQTLEKARQAAPAAAEHAWRSGRTATERRIAEAALQAEWEATA